MSDNNGARPQKRKKIKVKQPNPLFIQWVTEFRDEAKEKGYQSAYSFNMALQSLKKYPVVLRSGQDCKIIKNCGQQLCNLLDRKLAEYRTLHPNFEAELDKKDDPDTAVPPPARKRVRTPKKKTTAQNSNNGDPAVNGSASTSTAAYSTTSTVVNGPSKTTANGSPAKKKAAAKRKNAKNDDAEVEVETINVCVSPGDVKVKLLVDTGETSTGSKKASKQATLKELEKQDMPFEIRKLSVGDFAWVVSQGEHDLVLPYIVERKRLDDFAQSIKGGRYHEQKWRLKATGFKVIYMIESTIAFIGLPLETLCQAETNTEFNDGFILHRTVGPKGTVAYLATMTKVLQNKFKNKTLRNCTVDQEPVYSLEKSTLFLYTFKEMNGGSAKIENFTVREMFAQQLMQFSGTSSDTVCAIVEKFPTPALLREAFFACRNETECINQLTSFKLGPLQRSLPPEVARKIYLFYTSYDFNCL